MKYKESEYLDLTVGVKPITYPKKKKATSKTKSFVSGAKKFGAAFGRFADRLEIDSAGIGVGSRIKITNGMYKGASAKILGFIPGGIQCMASGQKVNIRHGSYKKL